MMNPHKVMGIGIKKAVICKYMCNAGGEKQLFYLHYIYILKKKFTFRVILCGFIWFLGQERA